MKALPKKTWEFRCIEMIEFFVFCICCIIAIQIGICSIWFLSEYIGVVHTEMYLLLSPSYYGVF